MEIRKAEIKDIRDISKIYALSWKTAYKGIIPQSYLDDLPEDFWVTAFEEWLSNKLLTAKIAFEAGTPVGCIAYGDAREEAMKGWGEIVSIYFLPAYIGKGYGTALFKEAINDMAQVGYTKIYLWVMEENLQAQEFYGKCGFLNSGEKLPFKIAGRKLNELRFIYQVE